MNDDTEIDAADEAILTKTVSDDMLEAAATAELKSNHTHPYTARYCNWSCL